MVVPVGRSRRWWWAVPPEKKGWVGVLRSGGGEGSGAAQGEKWGAAWGGRWALRGEVAGWEGSREMKFVGTRSREFLFLPRAARLLLLQG